MGRMIIGERYPRHCVRCGTIGVAGGPKFKKDKGGRLHCIKCHEELLIRNLSYVRSGPFVDVDPTFIFGELPQMPQTR